MPILVILDCDPGPDDATPNAFRVLELVSKTDVPVAAGPKGHSSASSSSPRRRRDPEGHPRALVERIARLRAGIASGR